MSDYPSGSNVGLGYGAADIGNLYTVCDQTKAAPASYTAQTSMVATTPFLIFYKAAGVRKYVIRRIELSQVGTVAGGALTILVGRDTASRYSSSGTALTPQNTNREQRTDLMDEMFVRVNATATAQVDANIDWIKAYSAQAKVGSTINIDVEDGIHFGASAGSLLIYVYAATTAPTFLVNADIIEE